MKAIACRFAEKFIPVPGPGCWLWSDRWDAGGYGSIRVGGHSGTMVLAHRASWELHKGPIGEGQCVLHRCDTPACVNPDHLFLGTRADNNADRHRKGRDGFKAHRGEENGAVKLTLAQVIDIRSAVGTQSEIARKYGISRQQVSKIKLGQHWNYA